jgi:hypothetical protein
MLPKSLRPHGRQRAAFRWVFVAIRRDCPDNGAIGRASRGLAQRDTLPAIMWTRRQFVATSAAPFIDSHVHVWKHDPAFPFAAGAHPRPRTRRRDAAGPDARQRRGPHRHHPGHPLQVGQQLPGQRPQALTHASSTASAASTPKTPPPRTSSPASPKSRASAASGSAPRPAPGRLDHAVR